MQEVQCVALVAQAEQGDVQLAQADPFQYCKAVHWMQVLPEMLCPGMQLRHIVASPEQVSQGEEQVTHVVPSKVWVIEHWMQVFEGVKLWLAMQEMQCVALVSQVAQGEVQLAQADPLKN